MLALLIYIKKNYFGSNFKSLKQEALKLYNLDSNKSFPFSRHCFAEPRVEAPLEKLRRSVERKNPGGGPSQAHAGAKSHLRGSGKLQS